MGLIQTRLSQNPILEFSRSLPIAPEFPKPDGKQLDRRMAGGYHDFLHDLSDASDVFKTYCERSGKPDALHRRGRQAQSSTGVTS
jgi:hypothetical protein